MLFDFQRYIEDGQKHDVIGRSQKGQVSVPQVIPPEGMCDFQNLHLLFLPNDKITMIEPLKGMSVEIKVYALTSHTQKYKLVGSQRFKADDIKNIKVGSFVSVISDESSEEREKFFEKFKWE